MSHRARALAIDALLLQHQPLWRQNPYQLTTPGWQRHYPALYSALMALEDAIPAQLQGDDRQLLNTLQPHFSPAAEILALIQQDISSANDVASSEPPAGVPGRKWQQIQAFCRPQSDPPHPLLEWCSGKSHLGDEMLSRYSQSLTALEIDPQLVSAARLRRPEHRIYQCDVLSTEVWQYLQPQQRILALHACGGLHQRLLHCAATIGSAEIELVPCCYHRFVDRYQPLSRTLGASPLQLNKQDLRSAVRQSCTARRGEIQARRQLQAWQFAFRLLLQAQGLDGDMPLPSLPHRWSKTSFSAVAQALIAAKKLRVTLPLQPEPLVSRGWLLLARAERLELARMAFRRLLELRCVLDSLLFLEEQHYHCRLSAFCSSALTPRNLMISARRK